MVPGTLCNQRLWQGLTQQLGQAVACEHIPIETQTTLTSMRGLIQDSMQQSPHLLGFSMGGYLSLSVAVEAGNSLQSLVVLASTASALPPQEMHQRAHFIKHLDSIGEVYTMPKQRLQQFISPKSPAFKDVATSIRLMEQELGPQVLKMQISETLARADLRDYLHQLQCPVLLIGGDQDSLVSVESLAAMEQAIPNAQLKILAGAGHMLPLEQPYQLSQLLKEFYSSL